MRHELLAVERIDMVSLVGMGSTRCRANGFQQLHYIAAPMTPGAQVSRRLPRRCSCACSSASDAPPSPMTNFVRWSTCRWYDKHIEVIVKLNHVHKQMMP
jgi:hypothetical protein